MRKTAFTKIVTSALSTLLLTAGLITSSFAGPESLRDNSKDKMVQAVEPTCDPRWYISIGGGVDFNQGEFSNGLVTTAGLTDLDIKSRDWNDVYNNFFRGQVEVGYVLTNHIELFAQFRYTSASSNLVHGSTASLFGISTREYFSEWSDYNSWGGDVGVRYFFLGKQAKIRPYISLAGGAAWVDSIRLHATQSSPFFVGGQPFTIYDGGFYDETTVWSGAAMLGVEFNVTCHVAVGIESGVRYESTLDGNDRDFNADPLAAINALAALNNDNGDRLSVPVTVYAKLRF
ncbi:MAG: hypothetical protein QOI04_1318 [Verrucomicrobiota bacterium]|jgi:hypothetical protein